MIGIAALAGLCASTIIAGPPAFTIERIASGLDHPVFVTQAPGEVARLFILERQAGTGTTPDTIARILTLDLASGQLEIWLTLDTSNAREAGAHALAFHPDFQKNGKFYVGLMADNPSGGRLLNRVVEGTVGPDGVATLGQTLLDVEQNSSGTIHAIGWMDFWREGPESQRSWLTIFMGDGGPQAQVPSYVNYAQDLSSLSGKVLRIDVDADDFPADPSRNYGIPGGNPFTNDADPDTLGEILHSGFRSPWRGGFDSLTGDLVIGDVGYRDREELDFARVDRLGSDFGWPSREGTIETPVAGVGGPQGDSLNPVLEWDHSTGMVSITGGPVYRGPIASWQGRVFFADFVTGRIFSGVMNRDTDPATFDGQNLSDVVERTAAFAAALPQGQQINLVVSFGQDNAGNLYIVDYSGLGTLFDPEYDDGEIYALRAPACLADWNSDGVLDFFDVQGFLGAFATTDPRADLNGDGAFDFFDVQAYLNLYSDGCD